VDNIFTATDNPTSVLSRFDIVIERVWALHLTGHKIGHFGNALPSQSLG